MGFNITSKIRCKPPWRILFFGTDEFSLGTLEALNENMRLKGDQSVVEYLHIVHPNIKKPTPITKYAAMWDLMGYEWPMNKFNKNLYDVAVLASFGHLIPSKILQAFPYGILNVHPSLLPRWRGAAPLHHTILNGDNKTGISIMSLEPKKFDVGPLLMQREFDVPSRCTTHRLRDLLAPIGGKMILETLSQLPEYFNSRQPQAEANITYAHKVTLNMSFIDWHNQSVDSIDQQYRAIHDTTELRTDWLGMTVRLIDMVSPYIQPAISLDAASPPGLPVYDNTTNILWVKCKDAWVGFTHIVIKKKMTAKEFYNGYLSKSHFKGVIFTSKANGLFDGSYIKWITERRPS
ncbi:methionyl-tRNA formyltransferase, mitochondrial-like [Physella acuta]|uniref:methionyl-tRNA formyltransferase, mitochondrial-like n=1 Tax=Physella acuta TaxID=109671 RepID=UPI0027DEAA6D|nr:methionyl-tRNA formyltransferase, mitochondrial-like [Physella acuta]XP_059163547.1 methionyl-tRNA formyltransferase, mitochondrial-like [Physella acuta]XP_059163548.1 methionyl-tRNA formyltransferase, mitochondrial-like [Physella acuta]XP_059163550.1 methionyl-tRNA formyltransferase, mitochondrial-like [Physella acuta]